MEKGNTPWTHFEEDLGFNVYFKPMGKLNRFMMNWRSGREEHFPVCCILRFSIENALFDGKTVRRDQGPAFRRGVVDNDPQAKSVFVPCNVFHHRTN